MQNFIPQTILEAFPIGAVRSVAPITNGLIHSTFKVEAEEGAFVFQRLHPVLAAPEIAEDFLRVTEFLVEKDFLAPRCILSKSNSALAQDETGKPWRVQTFLAGITFHKMQNVEMAGDLGDFMARFHLVLNEMPYTFQTKRVAHATEMIYALFLEAVDTHPELVSVVKDEVDFLREGLPKLFLPTDLPIKKVHGDSKITTFVFDEQGRPSAIIDLDTCN